MFIWDDQLVLNVLWRLEFMGYCIIREFVGWLAVVPPWICASDTRACEILQTWGLYIVFLAT